jgi:hypothetical protein
MRQTPLACFAALLVAFQARAADPPVAAPDEMDALSLADKAPATAAQSAQNWRVFLEGAATRRSVSDTEDRVEAVRASIDVRFDAKVAAGVRAVFSDRLDLVHDNAEPAGENVNTLREAYLSWARTEEQVFDLGRVNVRHGSAMGFNPTDWFKENALRSVISPDPAVLRENRQGTVVLRGQQLWSGGGVTATFSPRLSRSGDSATFAINAGATNPRNRWLLASSLKLNDSISPELLVYGGDDTPAQLGLNLSGLIGDSAVAFGEFAIGDGRSLVAQSLNLPEAESRQQRASLGVTYTTGFNLSITAEAEYNSAAPDRSDWDALAGIDSAAQQRLIGTASTLQDLPVRRAAFFHVTWKDAFVRRLDLSGFMRFELNTESRAQWMEARYRWDHADLALQWLLYSGDPGSVYRSIPLHRAIDVALRYYFH